MYRNIFDTKTFKVGSRVHFKIGGKSGYAIVVDTGEKDGETVYDLDNGQWAYAYQLERA